MYSTRHPPPYYSSAYHTYHAQPAPPHYAYDSSSKHKRRATEDGAYFYAAPGQGAYYYYTAADDAKPRRSSSHRHREHVSRGDRQKSHSRRYSFVYAAGQAPYRSGDAYYVHQPYTTTIPVDDHSGAYERKYRTTPPPPIYTYHPGACADGYPTQYQEYHPDHKARERRASYAHPHDSSHAPPRSREHHAPPTRRAATAADAHREKIPAGFSLKHWDPDEEPVLLLGSVFDANSLGKWIYDWTVSYHSAGHPLTEMAGELWLLLIQLAGKMKKAEAKYKRILRKDDQEMVRDYLDSGDRLWDKINKLLKAGEKAMLKPLKKSDRKKAAINDNSGILFVRCLFGRDHELDKTEKIMAGIRLWSKRFDVNCEDILRCL